MMQTPKREAYTFLTHLFGRGLEDERYAVERFRSMDDGDILPLSAKGPAGRKRRGTKRETASRRVVRQMRPARDEIIVCTGLRIRDSGLQLWGDAATGLFGERRQR